MDVGLVYHADYLKHDPGLHHPERADRLEAIMQALEANGRARQLVHLAWDHDPQEWVAKVHHPGLLQLVQVASQRAPVALDPDTVVSRDSFTAALKAVAGTLAAADAVMSGQLSQVFCAVRPPGRTFRRGAVVPPVREVSHQQLHRHADHLPHAAGQRGGGEASRPLELAPRRQRLTAAPPQ